MPIAMMTTSQNSLAFGPQPRCLDSIDHQALSSDSETISLSTVPTVSGFVGTSSNFGQASFHPGFR
jgi:hypothetical protein